LAGASKIAPHSIGLLAEFNVLSFQFVEVHLEKLQFSKVEQIACFADVDAGGGSQLVLHAFGFVDVAAEEVAGLAGGDEGGDGGAAEVLAFAGLV
jgi:hypothetical protein